MILDPIPPEEMAWSPPARAASGLVFGPDMSPALVPSGTEASVSYGLLRERTNTLAKDLVGAGIEPGAVVAYALCNGIPAICLFLATMAARGAAAPLNPAYTEDEFVAYLDDLAPALVVHDENVPPAVRDACSHLGLLQEELVSDGALLRLAGISPARNLAPAEPDDVALLLHTSGTTGKPKSVPIRQRNLTASATTIAATYGLGEADVGYCAMPLFHVHGLVASVLAPLAARGRAVIAPRFSAQDFWRDARGHGVTWFSAVPAIHHVLAARPEAPECADLRFARSCSAPLARTLKDRFEERFRIPLVEAYGMTEATHQMSSNPLPPSERIAGSVGLATGAEIAIRDEDWRELPVGTPGEVTVRGPSVIDGYLNAPDADAASFLDGWFRTGDQGAVGEDGYLRLLGRLKELVNRGGEKISPHEVEAILLAHPAVDEAVAFGRPHEKYGEVVSAAVVARSTEPAALRSHCRKHLSSFKVPEEIFLVASIPRGPTGKIQRRLLAEELVD